MSADNGIYVLVTKGKRGKAEYRVTHAQAIENINYFNRETQRKEYDDELINYFGKCKVHTRKLEALKEAHDLDMILLASCGYGTEYGICFIQLVHEFPIINKKE